MTLPAGPTVAGEEIAVEADVRPHISEKRTNAPKHRRPEALLVSRCAFQATGRVPGVYQGTLHAGLLPALRADSNGRARQTVQAIGLTGGADLTPEYDMTGDDLPVVKGSRGHASRQEKAVAPKREPSRRKTGGYLPRPDERTV